LIIEHPMQSFPQEVVTPVKTGVQSQSFLVCFRNFKTSPNKRTALIRITRFDAKKVMMNDKGSVRWYAKTRR